MAGRDWHDYPDRVSLERAAGAPLHDRAVAIMLEPAEHDDEPRPTFEAHFDYIFGLLLLPRVDHDTQELWYQEIDLILSGTPSSRCASRRRAGRRSTPP